MHALLARMYVFVPRMYLTGGGQKKGSDPQGLELQMTLSNHVSVGNQHGYFGRADSAINQRAIALTPSPTHLT